MRDLTQEEIDLAPDWATHYFILAEDLVIYENEMHYQTLLDDEPKKQSELFGMSANAKIIPSKAFDISDHVFSDQDLNTAYIENDYLVLNFDGCASKLYLSKADAVVIAKALGVTGEDL